jgi:DNA-binding transcriptional MerR regulator
MNETRDISIGELARMAGTKVVTVRYYEKIGLLPEPARSATNYRAYSQRDLSRLRFIRRCRNLGFTLDQVRELLRLSSEREHDCTEVDRIAASHLADVRHNRRFESIVEAASAHCRPLPRRRANRRLPHHRRAIVLAPI